MTKVCGVYLITCLPNSKRYVGSSINIRERWYKHRRALRKNIHENANLQNSWNKYGESEFEFKTLEETIPDYRVDREREVCRRINPEFNNKVPDKDTQHWHHGEESRTKISDVTRQAWDDPGKRANMVDGHKRRWQDPEQRKIKSDAMKAYADKPGVRALRSEISKKAMSSPAVRQKMSEAKKGKKHSLETRRRMSETHNKNKIDKVKDSMANLGVDQLSMLLESNND